MTHLPYFSDDYFSARTKFREAVAQAGGNWQPYTIAARGPANEELAIDAAWVGADRPERTVVVSSGLHGVEGFFGSAVQTAWLQERGSAGLPAGTGLLLLHALNPFGFAWRRRWNEENVDLNRNFLLSHERYQGSPPVYARLDKLLNPGTPPSRWAPFALQAAGAMLRHGTAAVAQSIPVGQYDFPRGLFYGGTGPAETRRIVEQHMGAWLGDVEEVLHIDLHSGLGRFGTCQLLVDAPPDSRRVAQMCERFGAEAVSPNRLEEGTGKPGILYACRGTWEKWCLDRFALRAYNFATAEFGTYSNLRVLAALRAENRAFHFAPPQDPAYEWTRLGVVEAFGPRSRWWREAVVRRGIEIIDGAVLDLRT